MVRTRDRPVASNQEPAVQLPELHMPAPSRRARGVGSISPRPLGAVRRAADAEGEETVLPGSSDLGSRTSVYVQFRARLATLVVHVSRREWHDKALFSFFP
jgi:hypothetical protein